MPRQTYADAEKRLEKAELTLGSMLEGDSESQLENGSQENPRLPFSNKQSA